MPLSLSPKCAITGKRKALSPERRKEPSFYFFFACVCVCATATQKFMYQQQQQQQNTTFVHNNLFAPRVRVVNNNNNLLPFGIVAAPLFQAQAQPTPVVLTRQCPACRTKTTRTITRVNPGDCCSTTTTIVTKTTTQCVPTQVVQTAIQKTCCCATTSTTTNNVTSCCSGTTSSSTSSCQCPKAMLLDPGKPSNALATSHITGSGIGTTPGAACGCGRNAGCTEVGLACCGGNVGAPTSTALGVCRNR